MAELVDHPTVTAEQKALLDEILGELVIEYSRDSFTSRLDGWEETVPYEVVAEGENFLDLRGYEAAAAEWVVKRVWVDGDVMWVWVEGIGFREYFTRLR